MGLCALVGRGEVRVDVAFRVVASFIRGTPSQVLQHGRCCCGCLATCGLWVGVVSSVALAWGALALAWPPNSVRPFKFVAFWCGLVGALDGHPRGNKGCRRSRFPPHNGHSFKSRCLMARCTWEGCSSHPLRMKASTGGHDCNGPLSLTCTQCSLSTGGATVMMFCGMERFLDVPFGCPRGVKHVHFAGEHHQDCHPVPMSKQLPTEAFMEVRAPGNVVAARATVLGRCPS